MSLALRTTTALLGMGGLLSHLHVGDGHLYMMNPISRQLWGTDAYQEPDSLMLNWCPHCFQSRGPDAIKERAGGASWPHYNGQRAANGNYIESDDVSMRHGICGDPEQTAEEGSNLYGQDNSNYPVLETHAEGGILEVKIVVSTYHWGHIEMFLCNADDLPGGRDSAVIQSCFNQYPLDRAEDDQFNGPIDPNHTGRFFLDPPCRASETDQELLPGAYPGDVATARFQLPPGVTCERCVVQMVYYTGNSCKHQGYEDFNPASWPSTCAPDKGSWINEDVGLCGVDGAYPEEFWNCADIEITADGGPGSAPTPSSESEPAPQPTSDDDDEEEVVNTPAPTVAMDEDDYKMPTYVPEDESDDGSDDDDTVYRSDDAGGSQDDYEYETTMYSSGEEAVEETPAPADQPQPTPSPLTPATPMKEPKTPLAAATFAPSVAPPVSTHSDCEDPVAAYGQCGGGDYEGSTCCRPGYECEVVADCYSECRPREGGCSEGWGQCGGLNWDGPDCCYKGATCLERNEYYSQCVPDAYQT